MFDFLHVPSRYPYNWNADRNQRRVLLGSVKRGATADAVSYSAPWWATTSGNVAGSPRGGPNLAPKNYGAFAGYAADVVLHYARVWGVTFSSLGPFNDPFENNLKGSAARGAAAGEACGFTLTQIPSVLRAFRAALKKRGLGAVKLAGVDDWLERTSVAFTNAPPIRNLVDRITVHGYAAAPTSIKSQVGLLPKLQAMNNVSAHKAQHKLEAMNNVSAHKPQRVAACGMHFLTSRPDMRSNKRLSSRS